MNEVDAKGTYDGVQRVYRIFDLGQVDAAISLMHELEADAAQEQDSHLRNLKQYYLAPCFIDIGSATKDEDAIRKGISALQLWANENKLDPSTEIATTYNLANGYLAIWEMNARMYVEGGIDAYEHKSARGLFGSITRKLHPSIVTASLACDIWTNYGNCLDANGRFVEAIEAYDAALRIDPDFGSALGNKAIALLHIIPFLGGHEHRFYLEAQRLLQRALVQPSPPDAKAHFAGKLDELNGRLHAHGEMLPEDIVLLRPKGKFQRFLWGFCAQHRLFLNPVTLLRDGAEVIYGDPMFITSMVAPIDKHEKFDRYITFLNQIKQDYVLGRYFLAQSQYRSGIIDAVDDGVRLYYPLDYSLHSTYIELLKASLRQAISVLDKVAYFVYDYCGLTTPRSERVSFKELWPHGSKTPEQLRPELAKLKNLYLFALFSLSRDVGKDGDWASIYEHRNAITHRFLVVSANVTVEEGSDIPRISEMDLVDTAVLATKIARAAVMYLVMFVAEEEQKAAEAIPGPTGLLPAVPVDGIFRHKPRT